MILYKSINNQLRINNLIDNNIQKYNDDIFNGIYYEKPFKIQILGILGEF